MTQGRYNSLSGASSGTVEDYAEDDYDYSSLVKKLVAFFTFLFAFSGAVLVYLGYSFSTSLIQDYLAFPQLSTVKTIENYNDGRLFFIGDVHGMFSEFEALKAKLDQQFSITPQDKFIFLGDFTSKGPYSDRIVDWMSENDSQVECIFGNHEVTTLFYYLNRYKDILDSMNKHVNLTKKYFSGDEVEMPAKKKKKLLDLSLPGYMPLDFLDNNDHFIPYTNPIKKTQKDALTQIGDEGIKYIAQKCSVVLEIPELKLIAAHAGLLPTDLKHILDRKSNSQSLTKLSINSLVSMKWVDMDDYSKTSTKKFENSIQWFKLWKTRALKDIFKTDPIIKLIQEYQVIYGHNSGRGLNLHTRTKGVDTACVSGGSLTAIVYTIRDGQISSYEVVSSDCH